MHTACIRKAGTIGAAFATTIVAVLAGVATATAATTVTRAPVVPFQAAGDIGGGVLEPGTTYPPTTRGFATLKRGRDWVQTNIATSGLPGGAYTVWWIVFDAPSNCSGTCGGDDLLNPDADVSVFWATGRVVPESGVANFADRHRVGDSLGDGGTQHILGDGLFDPSRAEIHNVIKYHGLAADDPDTLAGQVSTVNGSCFEGANAVDLGDPFGVNCFDPQAVAHPLP